MLWFFHPDSESEISLGIISPSTAAGEADDSSEQAKVTRVSRHRLLALARSQQDTQGSDTFHPGLGHANSSSCLCQRSPHAVYQRGSARLSVYGTREMLVALL